MLRAFVFAAGAPLPPKVSKVRIDKDLGPDFVCLPRRSHFGSPFGIYFRGALAGGSSGMVMEGAGDVPPPRRFFVKYSFHSV